MSFLYFFRHGQAGTRQDYDTLSDTGRAQARCLGEYLAAQPVRFSAVLSGSLRRQRETMEGVLQAYSRAKVDWPAPAIDTGWDEFDLFGIYAQVAPRLCAEDPVFREAYEKERQIAQSPDAPIHRQWTACDSKLLHAWLDGRFQLDIESWPAFVERVQGNRQRLPLSTDGEAIAIFTSATPMSVWVAAALEAGPHKIMRLTGAVYNSAMTVFRLQEDRLDLVSFNATPHLAAPELRTLR